MGRPTPILNQYRRIKESYPDAVVLMRLGDFYEAFDEDAETVAEVCGLTISERSGAKMAGFPYLLLHTYLAKLNEANYRVAVAKEVGPRGDGFIHRKVKEVEG